MDFSRLPKWFRFSVITGIILFGGGAGLIAYRWSVRPVTLTVAAGSIDGEASKLMLAIAGKFAQSSAPVRLNVIASSGVLEAARMFSSGKVDLAVIRGDVGDLSQAQAVAVVAHPVALLIAPPGSPITDLTELKRAVIGVIGLETNQNLIKVLTQEYDLIRANVTFKDLAPTDARRALESKDVRAILIVVPLTERYLALVRGLFPHTTRNGPVIIPLESAAAIAEREPAYESFDVPKGTLRGSPPIPAEDLTTLRASFYLVAQKKLGADLIGGLAQALMNARRDLLPEFPSLAQISAPDTGKDAYLPVHHGAAAFYDGTQENFLDKWGNVIFLAPMIAGGLVSLVAAAWKFLRAGDGESKEEVLDSLYDLGSRIRGADHVSDLDQVEQEIDRLLRAQRARVATGSDLTDILDQRDGDYCIAALRSRCCGEGADVCGAGGL